MTTLLERPKGRSSAGTALSGTLPQVNLLPPEVRAARGMRATKRWLVMSLVLVVVLCFGAFGVALIANASATNDLADAQSETARLETEAAKYAEVPKVKGALTAANNAVAFGMSTDVQWRSYLDAVTAVLPADISFETYAITVATPTTPAVASTAPLQGMAVGRITFEARTLTVPNSAAWITALNTVPGLIDATVSSIAISGDERGDYYSVTLAVNVTDAAYTHRFDVPKSEG
ncbi:hypothetical protein [Cellulomonas sp. URHD0024]|uniref:hypothetical protein n=1 Tax=Cellulomonas sp. URHD0024 TaxID=1302620 RepID=UPI00040A8665|nr:hypothetical protein [Cellulomonas sp. URHD0024]